MSITNILGKLLAEVDGALGVTFLDASGETIESAGSELSVEEMRTVGALVEIHMRQVGDVATEIGGETHLLHIEGEERHLLARRLQGGFLVVLVQRAPALAVSARRGLAGAAAQLEREILL